VAFISVSACRLLVYCWFVTLNRALQEKVKISQKPKGAIRIIVYGGLNTTTLRACNVLIHFESEHTSFFLAEHIASDPQRNLDAVEMKKIFSAIAVYIAL
jgi:hypothetical protein